jgi:hypothetical protein
MEDNLSFYMLSSDLNLLVSVWRPQVTFYKDRSRLFPALTTARRYSPALDETAGAGYNEYVRMSRNRILLEKEDHS